MKKEYSFIIECLKKFINNEKIELPNDLDFGTITEYASYQQVCGIVYNELIPFVPKIEKSVDLKTLSSKYSQSIYAYAQLKSAVLKIEKLFTENNIPFIILKGIEIASYYPQPFFRSMGDCDILVKREDKEKAGELLLSLGFSCKEKKGNNEWIYFYNSVNVEIHHSLIHDDEPDKSKDKTALLENIWAYAVKNENTTRHTLDVNFHFVFLFIHLTKHFINSGIGFRQFMDVAFLQKKCNLDWDFIKDNLTKLNLFEFAKTCFALIEKWFDVEFPFKANISKEFYEESTNFIMQNGVYGFNNEDNTDNKSKYKYSKVDNKKALHGKMLLNLFFPPYKVMRYLSHYSFINGKPFLLPVAWFYRFFRIIFLRRPKDSFNSAKDAYCGLKDDVSYRVDTLKKWGLKS